MHTKENTSVISAKLCCIHFQSGRFVFGGGEGGKFIIIVSINYRRRVKTLTVERLSVFRLSVRGTFTKIINHWKGGVYLSSLYFEFMYVWCTGRPSSYVK